jgi:hypothetical protein
VAAAAVGNEFISQLITEGKFSLDQLPEPYLCLVDDSINRLVKAINIVATEKGYRVVSMSQSLVYWTVCMVKEK